MNIVCYFFLVSWVFVIIYRWVCSGIFISASCTGDSDYSFVPPVSDSYPGEDGAVELYDLGSAADAGGTVRFLNSVDRTHIPCCCRTSSFFTLPPFLNRFVRYVRRFFE